MWQPILYILFAYLLGAIPTGYIIAKRLKGIDIRQHGSGNVGATNVMRVVGKKAGIATLFLDFLKGVLPVLGAVYLFPVSVDLYQVIPVLTAFSSILGHSRSIFIGFSGGKSVITGLGTILALEPIVAIGMTIIGVSLIKITRYVSLGSMVGALSAPFLIYLRNGPLSHIVMTSLIAIYIVFLHRANITRLLHHQENRI